jgi:DNA-binding IclR family transcriptional regulator
MKRIAKQEAQSNYKSISYVAKIFSCLNSEINTLTELARYCEVSKPTMSRLLKALEKSGFIVCDTVHREYYFGPLLNQLAANPRINHQSLISISDEEINRLAAIFGETVILAILIGTQSIRLRTVQSVYEVKVSGDTDWPFTPQHLQRAGPLALFSQLGPEELVRTLNNINVAHENAQSTIDVSQYCLKLDQVRQQGYAIGRGPIQPVVFGIAVPLKEYAFPACLVVVGLESRLGSRNEQLKSEIITSGVRISEKLHSYLLKKS